MLSALTTDSTMSDSIDQQLYSRQLYTLGHAAQARLQVAKVLVVGARGVGIEVAKNLALMGVHSISLLDNEDVTAGDLSANVRETSRTRHGGVRDRCARPSPDCRVHTAASAQSYATY